MAGVFGTTMHPAGLHRLHQPLHDPLPTPLPSQGGEQFQGMQAHLFGGLEQAARRIVPTAHEEQPMLQQHGKHFGVDLAENAPACASFPFINLAILFPETEEPLDLPACALQHEHLAHRELLAGHIGNQQRPFGSC